MEEASLSLVGRAKQKGLGLWGGGRCLLWTRLKEPVGQVQWLSLTLPKSCGATYDKQNKDPEPLVLSHSLEFLLTSCGQTHWLPF